MRKLAKQEEQQLAALRNAASPIEQLDPVGASIRNLAEQEEQQQSVATTSVETTPEQLNEVIQRLDTIDQRLDRLEQQLGNIERLLIQSPPAS